MSNKAGFLLTVESLKDGVVVGREVVHNLIPIEGINYLIAAGLKGVAPYPSWYIGIYEGNYTPVPADTMAAFPQSATESSAYVEGQRQPLVLGAPSLGAADNSNSMAVFTGNTTGKFIQGGFISSTPAIGASAGVLISAVRFSSPKNFDAGNVLRITAAFSISSN